MERYFKRICTSNSHSQVEPPSSSNEQVENKSRVELNFDDIIIDPGLRKPIRKFDVAIRDQARREYVLRGPCQLNDHLYPKTTFGNQERSFQASWYTKYTWLEYSISKDAAFCFWCYLFKPLNRESVDDAFISDGFTNWKKALERFNRHMGTANSCHNKARIHFESFQDQRHSVRNILWAHGLDIQQNALGNNELTSPRIQKALTHACASQITIAIINDIGDKCFSLMVDKARDTSLKEHMRVVLRYVNEKGCVIERFLAIVHVTDTSAESLKKAIETLFVQHGLSLSKLRGQGYDGASIMSGEFKGLKSLILQENPCAMYVHCFSHQLQLVLVAVAHDNLNVSEFFGYVTSIVNLSGASCKKRDQLRKLQHDKIVAELESGETLFGRGKNQETSLARPEDTRWGSHYLTLLRLCSMWSSVQEMLLNLVNDASSFTNKGIANGLLKKMYDYEFVFVMHLMKNLLEITNELSLCLQRGDQNIVQAMSLIASSKCQLQDCRENGWHDVLNQVNNFCQLHSIPILDMNETMLVDSHGRRRRNEELITNLHYYRVEIFCQVVDLIMQEMNTRFSEANTELLGCISCLHPRNSFSQFDVSKLIRLAELYPKDFIGTDYLFLEQQLRAYLFNLRDDPQFSSIEDLGILAQTLVETEKHLIFPLVYRLIELALVLPIATTSVERVFSGMKTVKTDLRNQIEDEWINDSLVAYVEKDIFSTIKNE